MNKLAFKGTKWLITAMILPVVCCNAHPSCCNSKNVQCDSAIVHCDSIIARKDSIDTRCISAGMCHDSINNNKTERIKCDSIICVNTANDSITNIILNYRKVECVLQDKNPQDTARVNTKKMLPRKLNEVLRYILLDEDNYKSNDIVYGIFSSSISYKLYQSRRNYVYAEFDFGLKKWRILDSKKGVLFQGDIKENNLQMLRFSRVVFPKDETLKIMQNNLKSL